MFVSFLLGEWFLLVAGVFVALSYRSHSMLLAGQMCVAVLARAFLIWAWGRRYASSDMFYLAWTLPMMARDVLLALGCIGFWSKHGITAHEGKLMTGDSSIATWGAGLLMATLIVRSMSLAWIAWHRGEAPGYEGVTWPAFVLATITACAFFSALAQGPQGVLGRIYMTFMWVPRYGFVVHL